MNNRGLVGMIVIVGVVLVIGFFWFVGEMNGEGEDEELCIPESCCHATECVLESEAPNCSNAGCTLNCEPGTLDCGQARCEFVDDKCEVVLNE
ncbi:hypothetical protein HN935_04000 [archaeon]|jgi:hypothetical protein|nr:hypothetical protein [archaeon]